MLTYDEYPAPRMFSPARACDYPAKQRKRGSKRRSPRAHRTQTSRSRSRCVCVLEPIHALCKRSCFSSPSRHVLRVPAPACGAGRIFPAKVRTHRSRPAPAHKVGINVSEQDENHIVVRWKPNGSQQRGLARDKRL
ncbi:hypothetical protein B0H12DRAFT_299212 [Mycena haematopus]|nr:hypothetical protein B0H12DRAFT_299212 [Mycena haematopus]